jgi:hypothetical protein
MSREHKLKCWTTYFDAVESGEKNFEIRRDDRGFQKGDVLVLQKWNPEIGYQHGYVYRGDGLIELRRRISYILTGGQFGIEPGYVVMALEVAE